MKIHILLATLLLAVAGCETADNAYNNDNIQGDTGGSGSNDIKEMITKLEIKNSCDSDSDCLLYDSDIKNNICLSCDSIDYSDDKWVGANEESFNELSSLLERYRQRYCGPAPGCPVTVTNINFEARCVDNVCEKVDAKKQDSSMECAQKNYGNPDYCTGLSEGDSVPSCDCNLCGCVKMPDGKIYPSCTERACGTAKN